MKQFKAVVKRLVREEEGAAATEYAILVAVIAGVVLAAVQLFDLGGIFTAVGDKVKSIISGIT